MSDSINLPKYPRAQVANEVGLRTGPPRGVRRPSTFRVVYSALSLSSALAAMLVGVISYLT